MNPKSAIRHFGSLLEAYATLFSLFWLFKFMVNDLLPIFYDYAAKDSSNNCRSGTKSH